MSAKNFLKLISFIAEKRVYTSGIVSLLMDVNCVQLIELAAAHLKSSIY